MDDEVLREAEFKCACGMDSERQGVPSSKRYIEVAEGKDLLDDPSLAAAYEVCARLLHERTLASKTNKRNADNIISQDFFRCRTPVLWSFKLVSMVSYQQSMNRFQR